MNEVNKNKSDEWIIMVFSVGKLQEGRIRRKENNIHLIYIETNISLYNY